ncbi:MAG TPA: cupin domain-containing protein [Planctomycetota bacterium]|nr:cupin domain-containing protein [Planctomycetota bacterium]
MPVVRPTGLEPGTPLGVAACVEYNDGAIVSRTLLNGASGTLTAFAFDAGQELSEHTAPFDAVIQVLDGTAEIRVGERAATAGAGELVLLPANVPHAVRAPGRFKMLLSMFRAKG